ncbi:hypothetical protein VTO42DRAFT_1611 [Malbranchea cinnamomea]
MHESKKRKLSPELQPATAINGHANGHANGDLHTTKPTAVFTPKGGRSHTVSIALPGSIIANAQSHDQKTHLAGSIARALAVFCVDEVVIFEDDVRPRNPVKYDDEYTAFTDPSHFLAHLLSYLETPPHLRKHLFPMHRNLRTAGTLPSLDMPHHIRANEWCEYREGVTLAEEQDAGGGGGGGKKKKKYKKHKFKHKNHGDSSTGTLIHTGLPKPIRVEGLSVPENTRITVKFRTDHPSGGADAVAPSVPREEAGYYWGYSVRRCDSLSAVFMECPFDGGYDLSFGTSERGTPLNKVLKQDIPAYKHLLLVFGGVAGLEAAVKADPTLQLNPTEAEEVFDYYVNILPGQGSRTIRTEEAVWLGLMGLQSVIQDNHQ